MSATHEQELQGPPHVHHMDSTTAYHSAKLGMWLFLATEILLFGGLFAAFALFRYLNLEEFHAASKHLDWKMGGFNTVVLIFSSFLAAWAVDAAQKGDNPKICKLFLGTIACGVIFLIVKYFEYRGKYEHGLFPEALNIFFFPESLKAGAHYVWGSPEFVSKYGQFFGLYYCMTMLHALHVILGMGLITWAYLKAKKNRFSSRYYTPVEIAALYWHLVDLIWIYLFPLLYLVG